jgi:Chaperone of endosialidase
MKNKLIAALLFLFIVATSHAQVGIGTTTPNSMLDVRGSLSTNYRTFTASTAAALTDNTLVFTGTISVTVTLPTAVGITGRNYWIKNASTTLPVPGVTIGTTSGQTIDGNANWLLDEAFEAVRVVSDGSNWYVLNQDVVVPKTATTGGAWMQGGNRVTAAKAIGTITTQDLPFITNNTEKMRINTNGYLGINTSSPGGRLQIVNEGVELGDDYLFDDYGAGTTQGIYMTKSRGTVAAPANLVNGDQVGWFRFIPRINGSISTSPGSAVDVYYKGDGTTNLTDMRLLTSGLERIRLSETGSVGINTTTFDAINPEKLLVDAGTTTSFNVISGKGSINNYLQLNIQNRSNGASASSDVVASSNNGNETVNFIDMGINSSGYSNISYPILTGINTAYLYATGRNFILGNGSVGYNMVFFTNGFNDADEKMRILSTGNVGIGVTAPADKLTVAGVVTPSLDNTYSLGKSTARWLAVYAANGTIQTSDARLKTNIEPLNYGLKEVMLMRPVRYNWKDNPLSGNKIGLIAQEVKKLVPEVVVGDETKESLGMNYAELVPVLINAVKEQQQQIDKIQEQIDSLNKKITVRKK